MLSNNQSKDSSFQELMRIAKSGTDMEKALLVREMCKAHPEILDQDPHRVFELLGLKIIIRADGGADINFCGFGDSMGVKVADIPPEKLKPRHHKKGR